ncbi:hypothetical protein [Streptomyces sp. NBC_01003]|uniref:hypothetical protein n=1 Tax=Streptomyces sp. NBC_01003 TaxID=2903714 RepID=UPI00386A86F9
MRRATGHTLREVCEERVRAPYGMDFFLRLPESEEPRFRAVQPMLPPPSSRPCRPTGPHTLRALGLSRKRSSGRCRGSWSRSGPPRTGRGELGVWRMPVA